MDGQGTYTSADGSKLVGKFKNGEYQKVSQTRQKYYDGKLESGAHYKGEMLNNAPHGLGTAIYPSGDKYVGQWKNGKKDGQGVFTTSDGSKLVGKFKNGEYQKVSQTQQKYYDGKMSDGSHYKGEMLNNKAHGFGTQTWKDGNIYVGQYKDGIYNGQGTFTFPSGQKYVGLFKDGNKEGYGTLTFPGEGEYVGQFKDGKYNGQGTFTFTNGKKYVGQFKDDNFHGQGRLTTLKGIGYEGQWVNGKEHGQGTQTIPNGVFVGDMKDGIAYRGTFTGKDGIVLTGVFSGEAKGGTIDYPDGRKYEGEWNGNPETIGLTETPAPGHWTYERPHGIGKMTYKDGKIEEGIWRKGKFLGKLTKEE